MKEKEITELKRLIVEYNIADSGTYVDFGIYALMDIVNFIDSITPQPIEGNTIKNAMEFLKGTFPKEYNPSNSILIGRAEDMVAYTNTFRPEQNGPIEGNTIEEAEKFYRQGMRKAYYDYYSPVFHVMVAYANRFQPEQNRATVSRSQIETFLAKFNLSEVDQMTIADWFGQNRAGWVSDEEIENYINEVEATRITWFEEDNIVLLDAMKWLRSKLFNEPQPPKANE